MTGCLLEPFVESVTDYVRRCSECGEKIPKGNPALASIKNGKVRKVVCSENCRLEFDARFWENRALLRARKLKRLTFAQGT